MVTCGNGQKTETYSRFATGVLFFEEWSDFAEKCGIKIVSSFPDPPEEKSKYISICFEKGKPEGGLFLFPPSSD